MKFQAAARAIPGSKEVQEDAFRVCDAKGADAAEIASSDAGVALSGGGLLLVADGIGGHYGGDVASKITGDSFVKTFFASSGGTEERLKASLIAANQAVADAQNKEPGLKDMGATLVAGFVESDTLSFVSVGDSLILRYREGELHRVNADHSYMEIADREALGSADPAVWRDVMTRKGRDSITIAVLGRALEDFGHKPQIENRKILPGDVLIFSSDGLETLTMVQIQNFIRELLPKGIAAVADGLINAVNGIGSNRNYQDNTTLVVMQADGIQPAKTPAISEKETAKTAATAPIVPKTAAVPTAAVPTAAPSTAIRDSARSGKWGPAKILLGIAIALIGIAAIYFATSNTGIFRTDVVKVAPAPAAAPAPEQGLQQRPALTPDSDVQPPRRAPNTATPNPGG